MPRRPPSVQLVVGWDVRGVEAGVDRALVAFPRLTAIGSTKDTTTLANWQRTLDDAGQPTRVDVNRLAKPDSHQYYTYDQAGRLLTDCTASTQAASCPNTAGTTYTYDGVGNRTTASKTGTGLQHTYTAYGQTTQTNTATNPAAIPFTYTDQYTDPTTPAARLDLRARNYDPTTGRFTSRDPVQQRAAQPYTSDYTYAGNAPPTASPPPARTAWTPSPAASNPSAAASKKEPNSPSPS
ncbi:RHS repeat-associated core domain-containing protein [Streptomyces sp. NPDC088910]|uniref:RHS repeat-associated core domain-containing protein n=1 Tax=Streptomyces sp. NPDC088910 TaxID=3365911 RepID=UPI0038224E1A